MRIHTLIYLVVPLVAVTPAFAQTSGQKPAQDLPSSASFLDIESAREMEGLDASDRADAESARTAAVARRSVDADARSGVAASGFLLRAGTDDSSVSLTLSTARDTIGRFGEIDLALMLTAPLDEQTKNGFLITRDGLPGGWSASFSLSSISGSYRPLVNRRTQAALLRLAMARCHEKARADGVTESEKIKIRCPNTSSPEDWGSDYLTEGEWRLYRAQDGADDQGFVPQELLFWSLNGAVNVTDFDFVDPTSFAEDEQRKVGYSLSGSIGFSPGPKQPFFLASAEYRQRWKAPDQLTRCPVASAAAVDCVTATFAPPQKDIDYKLSALARVVDPLGPRLPLALEIKGSFDAKDSVFGVEVPIYTFLDDAGKLRGGLRFGWQTDTDKVAVGVFIGAPFTLFN